MKRSRHIMPVAAVLGFFAGVAPALAQYYPYPPPPPRPYYEPRPYYGDGYYRPARPVIVGNICVTARGSCQTRPRPAGNPCGCNIPGFGFKRGNIANPYGY